LSENNEENEELEDELENALERNNKKTQKIVIEHKVTRGGAQPSQSNQGGSDGDLRKKLAERESQLAALALKEFEQEKERVLSLVPESKKAQAEVFIGNNPKNLEIVQFQYGGDEDFEEEEIPSPLPKGKAKAPNSQKTTQPQGVEPKQYENKTIRTISQLFDIVKDPNADEKVKAVANEKLDTLYREVARGRSNNPNSGRFLKKAFAKGIMNCPACGHVLEGVDIDAGEACPYCGFKMQGRKTRKVYRDRTMDPR
jgi:DNA-directed RNA polymerase subunit RPC12/RpoP